MVTMSSGGGRCVTRRDTLVTGCTDLGRLLRVALQPSTLHRLFCLCRPGEGEEIFGFAQFPMATAVVDPLQTLSAALAAPPDSREQADLLSTLRESLEARPQPIPILCTTLIKNVTGANDSLLKRWVLDLLHFAICRSPLSMEVRTNR
jgi:hypothetical protein